MVVHSQESGKRAACNSRKISVDGQLSARLDSCTKAKGVPTPLTVGPGQVQQPQTAAHLMAIVSSSSLPTEPQVCMCPVTRETRIGLNSQDNLIPLSQKASGAVPASKSQGENHRRLLGSTLLAKREPHRKETPLYIPTPFSASHGPADGTLDSEFPHCFGTVSEAIP